MEPPAGDKRGLARVVAVALVAALVLPTVLRPIETIAQEVTELNRISRADNDQIKPRISGKFVVWQDYRNLPAAPTDEAQVNADIFGRNLDNNDEFKVTDNHTAARPAVSGPKVVYTDSRNKATSGLDIRGFDVDASDNFDVVKKTGDQDYPAIDGNIVVWQDNRSGNWDIRGLELDSDNDLDIATRSTDEKKPAISGKRVVWEDYRKGATEPDIFMKDLDSKDITRISENGDSRDPDISGDNVVYRVGTGDDQSIQLYNIPTKDHRRISPRTRIAGGPHISGNLVVWADRRNDEDFNIWGYDLAAANDFVISRAEKDQTDPDISTLTVVWVDGRGDSPRDIRGAKLSPTATPTATPGGPTPVPAPGGAAPPMVRDLRYYTETRFRIDNDTIYNYFTFRGGIKNFGFPISRTFTFLGLPTQFFQRQVVQVGPNGSPQVMNLLDPGLMPYNRINFSTFPAFDQGLVSQAPPPGSPGYDTAIINFIAANSPDSFNGQPVNFFRTFTNQVTLGDAFPGGGGNPGLLGLLNLELAGSVTSRPASEPANGAFIYQRFQRVIFHFDSNCQCTQPLLLADWLKSIITGQNLPPDLDEQARGSRFYKQYNNAVQFGVNRPADLQGTDMRFAFDPG